MDDERRHDAEDRRWFTRAGAAVLGALVVALTLGLVILPIAQAPNAGIDAWTAICRAVGISPGTPAQPQPSSRATAAPVSLVRWTPQTLKILRQADPRPGAALAEAVCSSCHGEEGLTIADEFPRLAGQSPAAIYKQLADYQSGARRHPQMTGVVQNLTAEQLAQLAAYFGGLHKGVALGIADFLPDEEMQRLIQRGDPARQLPPCESCHARGSGGPPEAPVIAGQNAAYLERQLLAYKTGQRKNDVYRRMRDISVRLSDTEIRRLSQAYQGTY